ncbi:MAG: Zn-dependent exopeptidase M28 [Oscillospiraceae bacterium]|nr:Zn-dependent exopeptidase M28 [Oscillospiraceae bacterium]
MDKRTLMKILRDTAYVRMGGSKEELKCAEYIKNFCESFGCNAEIVPFEVPMGDVKQASLEIDGASIKCEGYMCCGSGTVEADLYYLTGSDKFSLSECKGKIVMVDGYLGYWVYQDLIENGAVGFITYDGNTNYADKDIDKRELRSHVAKGNKILGVNINAKDAVKIIKADAKKAKINVLQEEYTGNSHNVVLDLPGEIKETIVFTAHYDSTSLSKGAYDNMSGSVGLLAMAEHFAKAPHRHSMRFIWCGSEERGLLGAKAYCNANEEALKDIVLNINLDMIGCIMGKFIACCTSEDKLVNYISYMALEKGFPTKAYQDVYSSDSTPFADKGIPAVSFARIAPPNTATIHNSYDTIAVMKPENMALDIKFITEFAERMANSVFCPVAKEMPDNMKDKLDIYLCRKRDKK